MKIATPSDIKANDCVLFEYRGFKHIRRVTKVVHDERFAGPGGGGDLFVLHFEPRDELPNAAEYPPTNEIAVLDSHDLGDVFAAGCKVVSKFAEAAMTVGTSHVPHALLVLDDEDRTDLRKAIDDAAAT